MANLPKWYIILLIKIPKSPICMDFQGNTVPPIQSYLCFVTPCIWRLWLLNFNSRVSFLIHCVLFELESKGKKYRFFSWMDSSLRCAADNSGFLWVSLHLVHHPLKWWMKSLHLRTQFASIICASPFSICLISLISDLGTSAHLLNLHMLPWQLHQKTRARE